MKNIAIIPARSGSKGLKDKNIKMLCGKPMLAYSIEAAIQSGKYDEIYVSTDSEQYASIAKENGANVPFLRSPSLSGDMAGTWDVVKETIFAYEKTGQKFDTITVLQPTSPLREVSDIIQSFHLMEEKQANAVIGVCEMEHSPLWSNTLNQEGNMKGFISTTILNQPRQNIPLYYRINGSIYLIKRGMLNCIETLYDNNCYAYIMPKERSVDIDDELDFRVAEQMLILKKI